MKKCVLAGVASLVLVSGYANALSVSAQAGREYTNVAVGMGTESTGLALSGSWARNDDVGQIAGLGIGLNIPLGSLLVSAGGKGLYLNPEVGEEGYAVAIGGGLQWPLTSGLRLFGEYYYSPDSLSRNVADYQEVNAGLRWTIIRPISIETGYRYIGLAGKGNRHDSVVADGMYIGGNVAF